jgi:cytochrome c peroxidase
MRRMYFLSFLLVASIFACSDNELSTATEPKLVLPDLPYAYNQLDLPAGARIAGNMNNNFELINGELVPVNTSLDITPWGATLGRVLFYDTKLSLNNTVACATCHHQDKAFADGKQFSTGFEGKITTRNSMAIINPISQNNLFWDSRSKTLHDLSLQPVQNHIEMGMENLDRLVAKLEATDYYADLFNKAYGSPEITSEKVAKSISQFVGSITSNRSRFDAGQNNNFSNFNELETLGMKIFNGKGQCSTCHGGSNMAAQDGPGDPYGGSMNGSDDLQGATNIGLELVYKDNGLENGKFRIPSLRNIELTGPYMHDGRFKSLEEVINHYSEGIKPHKDLDVKFKDNNGKVKLLNLTSIEKKALEAFLKTLTDKEMTQNPKWSNPFQS